VTPFSNEPSLFDDREGPDLTPPGDGFGLYRHKHAEKRRAPNRHYQRKLDGEQEVRLLALACSEPPEGQARWSLRLLADKLVELEIVEEEVSYQTVRRILKKTNLSLT
jgi:hypothetical protein